MPTRARLLLCGLVVLLLGSREDAVSTQTVAPAARFATGELLIKFRPGASDARKAAARALIGAARRRRLRAHASGELELAALPARVAVANAIARLRGNPDVLFAEPNWILTHQATADDVYYTNGSLWGMYGDGTTPANPYGSQAAKAWAGNNVGSSNVYIGVIDEGIDIDHPDLAANIWTNPYDVAGDGIDNDGNGFVDDVHGWDFFQNDNTIYDGSSDDSFTDRHGTHVAGTIGAAGGNAAGVAGVNWFVTMIPAKFLGPSGGTTADAVRAIDYFTDLKTRHGLNIVATNNSWGGGGYSRALHEALIRAANADILFVAAAGNNGMNTDGTPFYPAAYDTTAGTIGLAPATFDAVISVTALNDAGSAPYWANVGARTVDLAAPGSGVWSTAPNNAYAAMSGTSMATPHVSGAAALYASMHPGTTASEVKAAILNAAAATPTPAFSGMTATNGRLNIAPFLPTLAPPAPPTLLTAVPASVTRMDLSWTDNSGGTGTFQVERCNGASCTSFAPLVSLPAGTTTFTNVGLAASTTYRYRVRAVNDAGTSAYSNVAGAKTPGKPSSPTSLTAKAGAVGSRTISLAWIDRSQAEDEYRLQRCAGATCTNFALIARLGKNVTTFVDTGLTAGRTYRYRVRAYNEAGFSSYSNIASAKAP
jgi:hypothetical protein